MGDVNHFDGVKVFSATTIRDRAALDQRVTTWLTENGVGERMEIVDRAVRQSSDATFHCHTMVLFYRNLESANA